MTHYVNVSPANLVQSAHCISIARTLYEFLNMNLTQGCFDPGLDSILLNWPHKVCQAWRNNDFMSDSNIHQTLKCLQKDTPGRVLGIEAAGEFQHSWHRHGQNIGCYEWSFQECLPRQSPESWWQGQCAGRLLKQTCGFCTKLLPDPAQCCLWNIKAGSNYIKTSHISR